MAEINITEMEAAYQRTKGLIHNTPIMTSEQINKITGKTVYFKCDHLQKTGSFKARGALNSVLLAKEESTQGVVTHSSGNHGQALAWAAGNAGLNSVINTCDKLARGTGFRIVEPSNCVTMINGHSSIAFELVEQLDGKIDSVFLAIGGGGLAASVVYCLAHLRPDIRVFLAEPESKNLQKQLNDGIRCEKDMLDTVADGVRVAHVGSLCRPILEKYSSNNIISVTENEIREALIILWTRLKQRVEPTAALAFAPLLFHCPPGVENAAVILCGGNVDANFIP
ncbi:unnamed protein product [Caenorhabditis bovis]|uniref:L-serine ammonia-lyase n=1 Tax=Caenorhabditis bovis TaxID=2654633 RepID=A0A8S1FBM0_9PELO|nr:unnamed protein product [Caenorhabditis bovis]